MNIKVLEAFCISMILLTVFSQYLYFLDTSTDVFTLKLEADCIKFKSVSNLSSIYKKVPGAVD